MHYQEEQLEYCQHALRKADTKNVIMESKASALGEQYQASKTKANDDKITTYSGRQKKQELRFIKFKIYFKTDANPLKYKKILYLSSFFLPISKVLTNS